MSDELLHGGDIAKRTKLEQEADQRPFVERYHQFVGREPAAWGITAKQLKHAADAVRDRGTAIWIGRPAASRGRRRPQTSGPATCSWRRLRSRSW